MSAPVQERVAAFGRELDELLTASSGSSPLVVVSDDMVDVLATRGEQYELETLLDLVRSAGRLILHGATGSGKTTALARLYRLAERQGMLPIYLNVSFADEWLLKRWHIAALQSRVDHLLAEFARPSVTEDEVSIDALPVLLLVDGLDVVGEQLGDSVLDLVNHLAFRWPESSLVVADRYINRDFGYQEWRHAALVNSDGSQFCPLANVASLLFDQFQRAAIGWQLHLTDLEHFSRSGWRALPSITEATAQQVELSKFGASLEFVGHHLVSKPWVNDRVLARSLARAPETWEKKYFDRVSLGGTYFDILALIREQLDGTQGEHFMRALYAWNLYSSAHALRHSVDAPLTSNVSLELELALLAIVAERQWDRFSTTAQAARLALLSIGTDASKTLLACQNRNDLVQLVKETSSEVVWFCDWRRWFVMLEGWHASVGDVSALQAADTLNGWTIANALKRATLSDDCIRALEAFLGAGDNQVRWRAAHVLGAFPSAASAMLLSERAAADPFRWVERTAIRSLMEMLAISLERSFKSLSETILSSLRQLLLGKQDDPSRASRLKEFERSVLLTEGPSETWADAVGPSLAALAAQARSEGERKRVELLAERLRTTAA